VAKARSFSTIHSWLPRLYNNLQSTARPQVFLGCADRLQPGVKLGMQSFGNIAVLVEQIV
jgi:hypothetical protein